MLRKSHRFAQTMPVPFPQQNRAAFPSQRPHLGFRRCFRPARPASRRFRTRGDRLGKTKGPERVTAPGLCPGAAGFPPVPDAGGSFGQSKRPGARNGSRPLPGGGGWIRTTEAEKQQIYSLPPLATRELLPIWLLSGRMAWSWWTDSNPRPADYKSAALPAELHQPVVDDAYYYTTDSGICQRV